MGSVTDMKNLFSNNFEDVKPLAERLRPKRLEDFKGQESIIGKNGVLRSLIEKKAISNMILYGPSGCGKTTLGEIISQELDYNLEFLNATVSSVNELKSIVEKAKKDIELYGRKTIIFLDEIHRFNKAQQDSLLSYIESGIVILIGATTENPYYSLNNALLSRCLVFKLNPLDKKEIGEVIERAKTFLEIELDREIEEIILDISNGDTRVALNYLELYKNIYKNLEKEELINFFKERKTSFDKKQDKYDIISAMIKSIRGSDPDASVYWLARLLYGGEDPRYIARRLVILASEDIGMANPEAMLIANSAMLASERIGMPEIRITLSQAVIYLAISTKSNSSYLAIDQALEDIKNGVLEEVPHNILPDSPEYIYPHSYENSFVEQRYRESKKRYYIPKNNRTEKMIEEKLNKLWQNIGKE